MKYQYWTSFVSQDSKQSQYFLVRSDKFLAFPVVEIRKVAPQTKLVWPLLLQNPFCLQAFRRERDAITKKYFAMPEDVSH